MPLDFIRLTDFNVLDDVLDLLYKQILVIEKKHHIRNHINHNPFVWVSFD